MNGSLSQLCSIGLTRDAVAERVARGQVNRVEPFTTRTVSSILRQNVLTVFNGVLTASVIALVVIGVYSDAVFLAAVSGANVLAGIFNELRGKWALDRLALLQRQTVTVVRDGCSQAIPLEEVVQDDVVVFGPGDQVIADGILVSSSPVSIDESLLTGEADAVTKRPGDPLLSGSYGLRGSGRYIVTEVGKASHVNRLTAQAKTYKFTRTPLQHDINMLIQGLTAVMMLFVLLLLLGSYVKEISLAASILAIVTVIKALVPEGLVLTSMLAFALGAVRAAKKQVLVQKLTAIESLSHLTTLCLDKTGTLGTNQLHCEQLVVLALSRQEVARQLAVFVGAVAEKNQTLLAIEAVFPAVASTVIDTLPFASEQQMSAVRVRDQGRDLSLWLGAPEVLATGQFTPPHEAMLADLRQQGLRVLLFASTSHPLPHREELVLLAFIVLRDVLRPDVIPAVKFYEERRVTLRVLSGDHPETVTALARQAGIAAWGATVNGQELALLAPDAFATAVQRGQFFGRLLPQQKQRIIQCLQEAGEFVGMVGDGVNDILAVKQADIGVALHAGAAATRDVADIILLQDAFAHLPTLSREGDRIIYGIKRVAQLFLTKNSYCLLFILFTGFVGLEFPLSPRSITWIDLLTVGTPATLLTLMAPLRERQSVAHFLRDTLGFALVSGLIIALCALVVYANFALFQDQTESYGNTAAVSVIVLIGLYAVFRLTATERGPGAMAARRLGVRAILLGALLLHLVAVYWPPLRDLLGLISLDADAWLTIVGASAVGIWLLHRTLQDRVRQRFLGM